MSDKNDEWVNPFPNILPKENSFGCFTFLFSIFLMLVPFLGIFLFCFKRFRDLYKNTSGFGFVVFGASLMQSCIFLYLFVFFKIVEVT